MIKKVVGLINQIISLLHPLVSQSPPVQNEVATKDKSQRHPTKGTNLKQCYYCGGAGILNYSSKFDGFEFSGRMGMRDVNTSPSNQCPLCRGTGFIEAQDKVED